MRVFRSAFFRHVLAKRYLCRAEPGYHAQLSVGSKRTLAFQGGAMTAREAAIFEAGPLFGACRRLRRYDERAKDPLRLGVAPFGAYKARVLALLSGAPARTAAQTLAATSFAREGNALVGIAAAKLDAAGAADAGGDAAGARREAVWRELTALYEVDGAYGGTYTLLMPPAKYGDASAWG